MNIQIAILGFLMSESLSGYEIKTRFENSISNFFDASFGAIYPALNRMERDGWVQKRVVVQEGRPNKNVYAITEAGKVQFLAYLNTPLQDDLIRSDFLLRVFFGRYADPAQYQKWMEEKTEKANDKLEQLRTLSAEVNGNDAFEMKALDYGLAQYEMLLAWLQKELDLLKPRI